jgi:hypothetical protein
MPCSRGRRFYGAGFVKVGLSQVPRVRKVALPGVVGASMVGLLGVGKGVLVGVRDWVVMAGWDGGQCPLCDYFSSPVHV